MTKFLNISTDTTLGGNSPSDETVSSQKALKTYIDAHSSGSPSWGSITGTLSNQTDLQTALNGKANDSDVVKLTGNQTIYGDKTFLGMIKGQAANSTNHAIDLGHNGKDYMDFYEYGAVWNFYKSRNATNTLVAKITENSVEAPALDASGIYILNTKSDVTRDTVPSSIVEKYIGLYDSRGSGGGRAAAYTRLYQHVDTSNNTGIELVAYKAGDTTSYIAGKLGIYYNANGSSAFTHAPTPTADTTSSNQIDTVGARNTKLDTLLSTLYPVDSIYITTANACPLSTLISGSTWELVGSGKVLQGADANHAVNTTISAGLPDITGSIGIGGGGTNNAYARYDRSSVTGAFSMTQQSGTDYPFGNAGTKQGVVDTFDFKASDSNSIYGGSTTVQPPAYCVNIYRRTA